ncbi:hypothetical protein [Ideonella oryzae]|uniref:Uncharacterized protein n=1 Tax=Ideonella oryzae TaxID=2937441 RepID=A0ABT1BS56_9BURK|nr:hypothetical protein [Ideonella oryzae]MCO5979013.1 hypothetical protein [Ideonella oryzae]
MPPSPEAARAGRAIGAMFFSVFGGLWIVLGLAIAFAHPPVWVWLLPALPALALLGRALSVHRRHRDALAALEAQPEAKQRAKRFHWINGGQWIAIFVLGNALKWLGLGAWFIPMVIAVVGLHFLPLARLFRYPPHQLTGWALIALAILAPLATGRPDNAWGPLGTGLILWASAAWALSPRAVPAPTRAHAGA